MRRLLTPRRRGALSSNRHPSSMNASLPQAVFFEDRRKWRKWLERNHDSEKEIWLLLYKKKMKRGMGLDEAVEEALCFGWIDSQLCRIDDERHQLRFSPRRPGSVWADSNLRRAEKLQREGKMTEKGACLMPGRDRGGVTFSDDIREGVAPEDLKAALAKSPPAKRRFSQMAKSTRVQYVYWISTAKRPETRANRIRETVRLLEAVARKKASR